MASKATALDQQGFEGAIKDENGLVLVDFWAEWCPPCKILGPTIDEVAGEAGEGVTVGKVDVDSNKELASQFGVRSIPTVVLIKGGEEVERFVGVQSKSVYLDAIAKHGAGVS
mgnify:FL=1